MRDAKPNAAHFALARLAAALPQRGGALTLVTQNIDNLHEQAGSRDVIHMHGELLKARCELCGKLSDWLDDLHVADVCPRCGRVGGMRPHVVWFGETAALHGRHRAGAPARRPVRRHRHFRRRLSGGWLRPRSARDGNRNLRDQPRVGRQRRSLRRLPLRAGERNRAGVGRGNPRQLSLRAFRS